MSFSFILFSIDCKDKIFLNHVAMDSQIKISDLEIVILRLISLQSGMTHQRSVTFTYLLKFESDVTPALLCEGESYKQP